MKKSQLKEAIKAEIKSVLSENRYDINDPNSPMGKLNDEYESSGLKGIVDEYGLDVVLMMLSSGEYGDRLNEAMSDKERENRIQHLMRTGAKEKPLRKLAAIGKKEDEKDLKEDRRRVVDYDNRDDRTTELFLDNGDSVEVDVIELYDNLKENNPTFADIREEDEMSDDEMDKKASRGAKKEPIGKEAERLAQVQKFMRQMQDKGIVGKDKKILDTSKYKEEFAKFKAGLKK
jgi:hypothetical protein